MENRCGITTYISYLLIPSYLSRLTFATDILYSWGLIESELRTTGLGNDGNDVGLLRDLFYHKIKFVAPLPEVFRFLF